MESWSYIQVREATVMLDLELIRGSKYLRLRLWTSSYSIPATYLLAADLVETTKGRSKPNRTGCCCSLYVARGYKCASASCCGPWKLRPKLLGSRRWPTRRTGARLPRARVAGHLHAWPAVACLPAASLRNDENVKGVRRSIAQRDGIRGARFPAVFSCRPHRVHSWTM